MWRGVGCVFFGGGIFGQYKLYIMMLYAGMEVGWLRIYQMVFGNIDILLLFCGIVHSVLFCLLLFGRIHKYGFSEIGGRCAIR